MRSMARVVGGRRRSRVTLTSCALANAACSASTRICSLPCRCAIWKRAKVLPIEERINTVRFRVKPGREQEFLDAQKKEADWPGLRHVNMIKTGERGYCIIGEWADMDALANARPHMVATLDTFRHLLDDLGGGLGVTDPISGPVVLELK